MKLYNKKSKKKLSYVFYKEPLKQLNMIKHSLWKISRQCFVLCPVIIQFQRRQRCNNILPVLTDARPQQITVGLIVLQPNNVSNHLRSKQDLIFVTLRWFCGIDTIPNCLIQLWNNNIRLGIQYTVDDDSFIIVLKWLIILFSILTRNI